MVFLEARLLASLNVKSGLEILTSSTGPGKDFCPAGRAHSFIKQQARPSW